MASQIAFDLYESATQAFIGRVLTHLRVIASAYIQQPQEPTPEAAPQPAPNGAEPPDQEMVEAVELNPSVSNPSLVTDEMRRHYEQLIQILGGEVRFNISYCKFYW